MKTVTAKARRQSFRSKKSRQRVAPVLPVSQEEIEAAPWSSGLSLLKHATGWAGDDLEELLDEVQRTRGKARF